MKANQVLLLVIKKVYFEGRGIGVVTVYLVYHLYLLYKERFLSTKKSAYVNFYPSDVNNRRKMLFGS